MAYLYRHIRLDTNEVFYIGIGSDTNYRRANTKQGRNNFWKRVTNKTEYIVEIVLDNLSLEEVKYKEQYFIKLYGKRDLKLGTLTNLTDGGDGINNLTKESRDIISLKLKGNKNGNYSKGRLGRKHSKETCEKFRINLIDNKRAIQKKVIDLDTDIIYESITEAAKSLGFKKSTLQNWVQGRRKNKTNIIYYELNNRTA